MFLNRPTLKKWHRRYFVYEVESTIRCGVVYNVFLHFICYPNLKGFVILQILWVCLGKNIEDKVCRAYQLGLLLFGFYIENVVRLLLRIPYFLAILFLSVSLFCTFSFREEKQFREKNLNEIEENSVLRAQTRAQTGSNLPLLKPCKPKKAKKQQIIWPGRKTGNPACSQIEPAIAKCCCCQCVNVFMFLHG